jgi:hypothetical protein
MAADKNLCASAFLLGMSAYSLKASTLADSMAFQFPVSVHPKFPCLASAHPKSPSLVSAHPRLTVSLRKIPKAYPTKSTSRSGSHPKSSQAFPTAPTSSVKSSLEPPATHASSSTVPKSVRV